MLIHVVGYHGTTHSCADKIRNEGFNLSGKDHWLGEGVYFFDNPSSAKKYGEAVIRADIYVDRNLFLDCFAPDGKDFLRGKAKEYNISTNEDTDTLLKTISRMVTGEKVNEKISFDVIRAPYSNNMAISHLSKPIEDIEIHFCVKNKVCISNVSLLF